MAQRRIAPRAPYTFQRAAWASFLHSEGLSESTVRNYCWWINGFLQWLKQEEVPLRQVTATVVDGFMRHLSSKRLNRVSLATATKILRRFSRYAYEQGWWRRDLAPVILAPRLFRQEDLPLGPAWTDVRRLIAANDGDTRLHLRNRAILLLLSVYGLRSGEVRGLRLEDIDWTRRILRVRRSKTARVQESPLTLATGKAIQLYLNKARPECARNQVSPVAVRTYLDGHGPVTTYWMRKWGALRGLYRFALGRGLARRCPLPLRAPKVEVNFTAYIYSQPELRRLLQAVTPERTKGLSAHTMRTLLLLLYGAGLRLGEALKLERADVNVEERLLHVRQSKFFKSRLVPIGPKLAAVLEDYETGRTAGNGSNQCFLRSNKGAPVSRATAERIFRALRLAADVKRPEGSRYQPRLHDLRHSMATHCLVNWYRQGADVQTLLVNLSVYLGHADISGTQKYLTITPDLRAQAGARFARYALGGSHE